MSSALELHDSRVSGIELAEGIATVYFSHAYIHKSKGKAGRDAGSGWTQAAELVFSAAIVTGALSALPAAVFEGYLEVGGIKHEPIPLPFKRKVGATLYLQFADGAEIQVSGQRPVIQLIGTPIYLEDFC